jgi:gliding motility-associated-like protein
LKKLFSVVFFAFLLICNFSFSQNPGNIGVANLTGWFKPDALPLGNVTTWTTTLSSLGSITVTDATAPYPQATNVPAGNVSNYNTTLFFNANTTTNLQTLVNTSSLNLLQNNTTTGQGTFFCAYYFPGGGVTNNHMMLWNNSPHAIQFRNLGGVGRFAIGQSASNSTNASRDWSESNLPTIISARGNRSTATSLNLFESDLLVTTNPASQSSGSTGLYFGNMPGNANAPYNGYLHEFIFYNTNLTAGQMRRVHSYMAIKYGITLDLTGGGVQGDYTSTTDLVLWDASASVGYHNNVIGIGRDDTQALLQKQSHAFDDNYRLYLGALNTNNAANASIFNANVSYVMMGENLDGACGTVASNTEAPAGISSRLAREWKVTNTNFAQNFNWDVKIDTCQIAGTSVGPVNPANFRLLVDTDGDFSNATVYTSTAPLNISYANGIVTVSGIGNVQVPINTSRYLTLAYNQTDVTFSGNDSICNGDSTQITVNVSVPGPVNFSYSNGTTTTNLVNISDGYTFYVAPTVTTTYSVLNQNNFFNCCGSANPYNLTVTVLALPTITANATINPICIGDSTQLSGSGGTSYVWDNGVTNGGYASPIVTTMYHVIGTDIYGCVNTDSVNIVTNTVPVVGATADTTTICNGDSVLLNGTGATTYVWNNGAIDNSYTSPTVTTTYIVTGTTGTCSDTASIQIVVNGLPPVVANTTSPAICLNDTVALFGTGAVSFAWNNGVTDNVYFSPVVTTTYTVTGTDGNNCQNTDTISVIVYPLPAVLANATSLILCEGDSTQLSGSGASTYVWDNGITNGDWAIPLTTTLYTVIGTDVNGCLDTNSVNITVNPNPVVGITATVNSLCVGDPVTLSGTGASSYVWTNGVIDNVPFNPTSTSNYTVTGTNGFGCTDTASTTIIVYNLPIVVANTTSFGVCEGDPVTLSGAGATSYVWDNGVANNLPFVPTSALTYTVTGTDANNCMNTANVFVDFYPIIPFSLGPDTIVCPQKPISLFGNVNFTSYSWSNGSSLPSITVNFAGLYVLTVTDIHGCVYSDDQLVVLGEDCFPTLYIPNTFTPNGDEHNDFLLTTGDYVKSFNIRIYDRWGVMMFESSDLNYYWDGTFGGKKVPDGVYTYVVKYAHDLNTDEKLTLSGHVNVMR